MTNLVLSFHVLIGATCLALELWFIRARKAPQGECQRCHSRHFWNHALFKAVWFCRAKLVRVPLIGLRLAEMDKVVMLLAALLLLKHALKDGENGRRTNPNSNPGPGTNFDSGTNSNSGSRSGSGTGTASGTR